MRMRAISNGDTILIMRDSQHCIGPNKPVAAFYSKSNTLEVHSGCSGQLDEALTALRKYREEHKLPATPVRVEYW